jgi:two-component system CheB/CheR fusion protein
MSANNDLVNLLASVQIPIVMVSQDLRIRRFTPAAEGIMNIIPSDIGRPIGHLKPNFHSPDLEALIEQVIRSGADHTGEVETQDGRLFAMQIRPYRVVNNQADGAVLALIDVSSVRQQEAARLHSEDTEDAFLDLAKEPTVMLDAHFGIQKANRAFWEQLGRPMRELQGRSLFEVGGSALDRPEVHELLERTLPAADGWAEVVLASAGAPFGRRRLRLRGRRVTIGQVRDGASLLLFEDVAASALPH